MLSFTIDRHTTISDILDDFNGYYSYSGGHSFRTANRGKGRNLKEKTRYRNEDFKPAISNPLEISSLNRYDED
jgi:cytidylate kinase